MRDSQQGVQQRVPTWREANEFMSWFIDEYPTDWGLGVAAFDSAVGPQPRFDREARLFLAEWALFDWPGTSGETPAQEWARRDPSLRDWARAAWSRYEVIYQCVDGRSVVLRDVYDGGYLLADAPEVCQREGWTGGSLGIRLAQVGGTWVTVGVAMLHDNVPWRESVAGGSYDGGPSMLADLRLVIGDGHAPVLAVNGTPID